MAAPGEAADGCLYAAADRSRDAGRHGRRGLRRAGRLEPAAARETARKRTAGAPGTLTAQEFHIARFARDGRTKQEIGAQLFPSARTVEWHLRKVFTQLGIRSRQELHGALALLSQDPQPA